MLLLEDTIIQADLAARDFEVVQRKMRRFGIGFGFAARDLQALDDVAEVEPVFGRALQVDHRGSDLQRIDDRRQVPHAGDGKIGLHVLHRHEVDGGVLLGNPDSARRQGKRERVESNALDCDLPSHRFAHTCKDEMVDGERNGQRGRTA